MEFVTTESVGTQLDCKEKMDSVKKESLRMELVRTGISDCHVTPSAPLLFTSNAQLACEIYQAPERSEGG